MSVPLQLAERSAGDVVILELHGQLVVDEGDRALREHVRRLAADGRRSILVDLGDVSYVDSAASARWCRCTTSWRIWAAC